MTAHQETRKQRRERERREDKLAKATASGSKEKRNESLTLASFAFTSWGWTVIAPASSATFGSALLLVGAILLLLAVSRMWSLGRFAAICTAAIALVGFGVFDWYIVVRPERGKPFQALLVHGYHLADECGSLKGRQEMPEWMRDESKQWQAQAEQLISERLPPKDSQVWRGAIIYGKVADENLVAYQ